jgi:hypothetical protein
MAVGHTLALPSLIDPICLLSCSTIDDSRDVTSWWCDNVLPLSPMAYTGFFRPYDTYDTYDTTLSTGSCRTRLCLDENARKRTLTLDSSSSSIAAALQGSMTTGISMEAAAVQTFSWKVQYGSCSQPGVVFVFTVVAYAVFALAVLVIMCTGLWPCCRRKRVNGVIPTGGSLLEQHRYRKQVVHSTRACQPAQTAGWLDRLA